MYAVGIGVGLEGADWLLPDTASLSFEALSERIREFGNPAGIRRKLFAVKGQ
jgi:hypothetical protein